MTGVQQSLIDLLSGKSPEAMFDALHARRMRSQWAVQRPNEVNRGRIMDISTAIKEITSWPVEDRVRLVEALCESIDADSETAPITEAQKQELSRRLADHLAHPDDVVPWEEVRARALARARR